MSVQRILNQINRLRAIIPDDLGRAIDEFVTLYREEIFLKEYENDVINLQGRYNRYFKNPSGDYKEQGREEDKMRDDFLTTLGLIEKQLGQSDLTPDHPKHRLRDIVAIEQITRKIAEQLKNSPAPLVIHGVGGVGKSTIAQNIYRQYQDEYDYFGWVRVGENFELSFVQHEELLNALHVPLRRAEEKASDKFKEIEVALKKLKGSKLLVLDNADWMLQENEFVFLDSLHGRYGFRVLVTSRIEHQKLKPVEVPHLDKAQATELFYLYYGDSLPKVAEKDLSELLKFVGYHPLLIELCAKTLWEAWELNPVQILDHFKRNELHSMEEVIVDRAITYEQDTITGFLKAVFDLAGLNEEEKRLLMHLSVLCSQPVSFEDLCFVLDQEENKAAFRKQLTLLSQKGWINREGASVMVHPAVAVAVKSVIKPDEENCKVLVVDFVSRLHRLAKERADIRFSQTYYLFLLENIAANIKGETLAVSSLHHKLGILHLYSGNFSRSLDFQRKSLAVQEQILAPDHYDLSIIYNDISLIYRNLGDFNNALHYVYKAIAIRKKTLLEDHIGFASCYNNLAIIYYALRNLERALYYQVKAVHILEKNPEMDGVALASAYNNLASIYQLLKDLEQALHYQERALSLREKLLPVDHPDVAQCYSNLSVIYIKLQKISEAYYYQKKALIIREKILSAYHPELAQSYHNLAFIYVQQQKIHEAIIFQQKAVDIFEISLPNGHPELVEAVNILKLLFTLHDKI